MGGGSSTPMNRVLVVGAGFAGAVHARRLAEAGYFVDVIDKRAHIGGNAYDFVDENGIRVHAYGPHLLHTKNRKVLDWLYRFAVFEPYEHKVRALLHGGQFVPLPINLDTVNAVFGTRFTTDAQMRAQLRAVALPDAAPANAAAYLYASLGRELTDLFYRPYTRKMWALELEEMAVSVVRRVAVRFDRADGYFAGDEVQLLPRLGYTKLFESMLDHGNIRVSLATAFREDFAGEYMVCFNSMPIDEYFGFVLGELPYRSLRFHHRTAPGLPARGWSVTNFTDDGQFTRETAWHLLPCHVERDTGRHTLTLEEPCDYRENFMERYYPVATADGRNRALYRQYLALAAREPKLKFIGRCGTYRYLDMDQAINQALASADAWLERQA